VPGEKFVFENQHGHSLAARLDQPKEQVKAMALFAHCFTCTKDIFAANQIAKRLNAHGIGVLRFDFTGLGASEGEFENTNFTSNVEDILAAAQAMSDADIAPSLIIGHSLGGAAVLKAARHIESIKAVVTIAAPFDPGHVEHNFDDWIQEIETKGIATVKLVGRPFQIKKQFLDDIRAQSIQEDVRAMRAALLVLHSPIDQTVGIENAERIFVSAVHPKSFVSLNNADHLISKHSDARYVADVIQGWSSNYLNAEPRDAGHGSLPPAPEGDRDAARMMERGTTPYTIDGMIAGHAFVADEPQNLGGQNLGPTPFHYLRVALGTCTLITLRMYIGRKKWQISPLKLTVEYSEGETGGMFKRSIYVTDDVTDEQAAKLIEIGNKCPVHKLLEPGARIVTELLTA